MEFSRNEFFIAPNIQKKLADITVLLCGSGMGSAVAECLVRTGVSKIIFADGDTVEESNLNRQNFTSEDIGHWKVDGLKRRLLSINPNLQLTIVNKYLDKKDLSDFIPLSDFVVNTIDFDSPVFLDCHKLCKTNNVVELFPTNIFFGGSLIVNTPKTPEWTNYYNLESHHDLKMALLKDICSGDELSKFTKDKFVEYFRSDLDHDPQINCASLACSILISSVIVKILEGEKVKQFPQIINIDPIKYITN